MVLGHKELVEHYPVDYGQHDLVGQGQGESYSTPLLQGPTVLVAFHV